MRDSEASAFPSHSEDLIKSINCGLCSFITLRTLHSSSQQSSAHRTHYHPYEPSPKQLKAESEC